MGVDRKGPLAAFVVIAIIAAILLVTSVRSQAEPSIVAAPPAVPVPHVWDSVGDQVQQVVEAGVTLVHKATSDPTTLSDPSVTGAATSTNVTGAGPGSTFDGAVGTSVATGTHRVVHRLVHPVVRVIRQPVRVVSPRSPLAVSRPLTPGHGRHLGWAQIGQGHGRHLGWAKRG